MAEALARGLIDKGVVQASQICCSDPAAARKELFRSLGATPYDTNLEVTAAVAAAAAAAGHQPSLPLQQDSDAAPAFTPLPHAQHNTGCAAQRCAVCVGQAAVCAASADRCTPRHEGRHPHHQHSSRHHRLAAGCAATVGTESRLQSKLCGMSAVALRQNFSRHTSSSKHTPTGCHAGPCCTAAVAQLLEAAGPNARVCRVMPNTPCLVGETAAAMCLGGKVRRQGASSLPAASHDLWSRSHTSLQRLQHGN